MREEFYLLIKSFGTWTVSAAETKSIGLQADSASWRMAPCFLLTTLTFSSWPKTYRPPTGTGKKRGTSIRRLAERQLIKPPGRWRSFPLRFWSLNSYANGKNLFNFDRILDTWQFITSWLLTSVFAVSQDWEKVCLNKRTSKIEGNPTPMESWEYNT